MTPASGHSRDAQPPGTAVAPSPRALPDRLPVVVAAALIVVTLGAVVAHQGLLLRYLFPVMALGAAVVLYRTRPCAYLSLVWWLWILTPEVRRLSDYQAGYDSFSPIMLAPMIAAALSVFTLLRQVRSLSPARIRGFVPVLAGLGVAAAVGVVLDGTSAAIYGLATWIVPPLFAVHLALGWRDYPEMRRTVMRLAVSTVLVISAYCLVQFFVYPGWDRYWGVNSGIPELANATATHFRPFSTLNSAGPFAFVLTLLLLFVLQARVRLWPLAMALGVLALAITRVRASWGIFVIGVGYLVITQRRGFSRSLRAIIVVAVPLVALGLQSGPVAQLVDSRLNTLSTLSQDQSLSERISFFTEYAPAALFDPFGHGTGSTSVATKLISTQDTAVGQLDFDNGFLDVPYALGWLGTALYVLGAFALIRQALRAPPEDPLVSAARAVGLAVVLFLLVDGDLTGVMGFFAWAPLGLALASRIHAAQGSSRSGLRATPEPVVESRVIASASLGTSSAAGAAGRALG